jgi:hypothetical protein
VAIEHAVHEEVGESSVNRELLLCDPALDGDELDGLDRCSDRHVSQSLQPNSETTDEWGLPLRRLLHVDC